MLKPRHFLVLVAAATVGAVGYVLKEDRARTPAALLAAAKERLESEEPDYDTVLRELDLALALAKASGDRDVARDTHVARGDAYVRRGAPTKGRAEFMTALTEYAPGSPDILMRIGWADIQLGNHNATLTAAGTILAQMPWHGGGHALRGYALQQMAGLSMEEAEAILEASLPDALAEDAGDLAWRAATLDFGHPHRNATLSELDDLLGGGEALDLRRFIDAATTCLTEARSSYVAALQGYPDITALVQLLVLLERGRRYNDVVDLGVAATAHAEVQERLPAIEALVAALDGLHRPDFANAILSRASEEKLEMTPSLLSTWCRLLYEAEDWRRLETVGRAAINEAGPETREVRQTAVFFTGLANLNLARYPPALNDLRTYVADPPRVEPVPKALALAYEGMAAAQRELGARADEQKHLERALSLAPDLGTEAWVRLSEVRMATHGSIVEAAENLVPAIALERGARQRELMGRWQALSERVMDERGLTVEGVKRAAASRGSYVRIYDPRALTWEFFAVGKLFRAEGQAYGMIEAGRAILERYPDHVLGLDLVIEGQAANEAWSWAVELLIRRANLYGPYPGTRRIAAAIPPGVVSPQDFLKLMELDPESTGVARVVQELRREGEDALALEGLRGVEPEDRDPGINLLYAELSAELGYWRYALEAAGEVDVDTPEFSAALELALIAAAELSTPEVMDKVVQDFLERALQADLDPARAERAGEILLAYGRPDDAEVLLAALDSPEKRTGTILVALALTQLAADRASDAEHALDRSEPFLEGPEPGVGRLALLAETGRYTEIPAEAGALKQGAHGFSPAADAALLGLTERVRESALTAQQALAAERDDPEWLLVLAAANALLPEEDRLDTSGLAFAEEAARFVSAGGRDPRAAWVLLAALATPTGAAWVLSELPAPEEAEDEPFSAWVRTRAWDRLGLAARAHALAEELAEQHPGFIPVWDRLEADLLVEEGTRLSPRFPAFLERREDALGPDAEHPARAAVIAAQRLAREGAFDAAWQVFEDGRLVHGDDPLAAVNEARLLRVAGKRGEAVMRFGDALLNLPPEDARLLVHEFLALGTQAHREQSVSTGAWRAMLAALKERLPDSPTASLAWARFERQAAEDKVSGWTLAREEYERFRAATGMRSLDELEPGSAAAWAEFFLSENPREAEAMIRAELPLSPGSLGLWRLLAEALEGQGKIDAAFERYAAATSILPDTRTMRRAAAILAQRGNDHPLVEATLERIRYIERLTEPDPALEILRARSLSNGGLDGVHAALPLYELLWENRHALRVPSQGYELGVGYAVALLHRGDPADSQLIRAVLDEVMLIAPDPYRRDLLQAYSYLAQFMPSVRTEEAGVDAEAEAEAGAEEQEQAEGEGPAEEQAPAEPAEETAPGDAGEG